MGLLLSSNFLVNDAQGLLTVRRVDMDSQVYTDYRGYCFGMNDLLLWMLAVVGPDPKGLSCYKPRKATS